MDTNNLKALKDDEDLLGDAFALALLCTWFDPFTDGAGEYYKYACPGATNATNATTSPRTDSSNSR